MKVLRFQTSVTVTSSAAPPIVYETVTDLKAHLVWSGERASDDGFKLLSLEGPDGAAGVGTTFSSTGANFNGTFHDRSVVTEASPPSLVVIQTEARLERERGKPWGGAVHPSVRHRGGWGRFTDHLHGYNSPYELRALLAQGAAATDHQSGDS